MRPLAERLQEALGTGYEIGDELPGGGMSRLFLAVDRALGRQVVVKVLPEDRLFGLSPDGDPSAGWPLVGLLEGPPG